MSIYDVRGTFSTFFYYFQMTTLHTSRPKEARAMLAWRKGEGGLSRTRCFDEDVSGEGEVGSGKWKVG